MLPTRRVTFPQTGTNHYHFTATPTLATRYRLEVFLNRSSRYPIYVSRATIVYVIANYHYRYNPGARPARSATSRSMSAF